MKTLSTRAAAVLLLVIAAGAFFLRVSPAMDLVFRDGQVNFQEGDGWYHVRLAENLVRHYPRRTVVDPYARAGGAVAVPFGPMHDWIVGGAALVFGLGAPSEHTVHLVAAWYPAMAGALIPLLVFLIGQALFGQTAGLIAAAVIATLPGGYLKVTQLGFADHHCSEALFSTAVLLLLVKAIDGEAVRWALAAGVAFGFYLLTWDGGAFLVAIVAAWAIAQILWDRVTGRPYAATPRTVVAAFAVALAMIAPVQMLWREYAVAGLAGGMAAALVLALLARLRVSEKQFAAGAAAAGLLATAALFVLAPALAHGALGKLHRLAPGAPYVEELQPLFRLGGRFSLRPAVVQFGASIGIAAVALPWLWLRWPRKPRRALLLFLLWSTVALAATLGQVRMTTYAAVPAALLAGYGFAAILEDGSRRARTWTAAALAFVTIGGNVVLGAPIVALDNGPTPEWREALTWMRSHTPEPFGSDAAYYRRYGREALGTTPAWAVMNWWDYGYWIVGLGHRVPVANGTQRGVRPSGEFYATDDEARAVELMRQTGARYAIVSDRTPIWVASWFQPGPYPPDAGRMDRYMEVLEDAANGSQPVTVYYPQFFRSMAVRLFLFDGQAMAPRDGVWAVAIAPAEAGGYRRVMESRRFETIAEAEAWVTAESMRHPEWNARTVSVSLASSCVEVPELRHFRRVFPEGPALPPDAPGRPDGVKIFELQ